MASTYPLEVVQADGWARGQKLKEGALKAEADKQPWDRSIKALIATPTVLEMMSKQLDWTEKLGNAALAQQADVMAAIQRLRSKAYDNKKLTSTKEQIVTFAAPDYIPAGFIGAYIVFGAGYLLGRWTDGGNYWGGGIYWDRGDIAANRPINIDRDRVTHWQHDPRHRRGLEYPHANVRQKFASTDSRPGREARDQLRTDRHTTLKPGAGRPGAADRSRLLARLQPPRPPRRAQRGILRPRARPPGLNALHQAREGCTQTRGPADRRELRRVPLLVRASPDTVRDKQALAGLAAASEAVGSEGEDRAAASVVADLEEAAAAGKDVVRCAYFPFHHGTHECSLRAHYKRRLARDGLKKRIFAG
jgi:hypothetical protein